MSKKNKSSNKKDAASRRKIIAKTDKMVQKLKKLSKNDKNFSSIFLTKSKKNGVSFVLGSAMTLHQMLEDTARKDKGFATVIKQVAARVEGYSMDDFDSNEIPKVVKDAIKSLSNVEEIDLPNGDKALSIDPRNIDKLTDEDIDNILDNLLGSSKDNDES